MAKFDVGVIGVWYGSNYGSIITYYALHNLLESMGKSVLMIDKYIRNANDWERGMTHARRFAIDRQYNISKQYRIEEFSALNEYCDAFVLGSDQLWNYGVGKWAGKTYYLDFAKDEKKKIAYATSFGHAEDFAPERERQQISKLMARFDGIGLREDDGVRIAARDYGIRAIQVADPVFSVDPAIYSMLIEKSQRKEEEPFLAAYILDPTPEKTKAIQFAAEKLGGLKVITLLDGNPYNYSKNRERIGLPNCIENLQAEEWLSYLNKASFIITDSCHGASFAMIFRKNFVAIANRGRGFSRFQSLGRTYQVSDRIVKDANEIMERESLLQPMDYSPVEPLMNNQRAKSTEWLASILSEEKKPLRELVDRNVIEPERRSAILCSEAVAERLEPKDCPGCGACVSACPVDAISLKADKWGYYRSSVDYEKCINCGKCAHICPALQLQANSNTKRPDCFEFVSSDDDVLRHSSSGGIFTTLAKMIFAEGGAVVGAAWKDDFSVKHIIVEREEDLWKLQKSKYLQSYVGDVFRRVKILLEEGRSVMFTGTPCQVTGLRAYLGKDYEKLLAVDILCGNAPSSMFFKKYIDETFGDELIGYEFRHKSETLRWDSIHVQAMLKNGETVVHSGGREDNYQRVYHNHTMCAPHCENCRYQAFPRVGDLSIGDFWWINKHDPAIDTFKGVSMVLCNNDKGRTFFSRIPASAYRVKKQVPLEWMGGNGHSLNGGKNWCSPVRDAFYEVIPEKKFSEAVNYALKPNHGQFRAVYNHTNAPLQFDSKMLRFHFEQNVWEELSIEGRTTLIVKNNMWRENGHYARLSMAGMLKKDRRYRLSAKIQIQSKSDILNFHIIDSGSKQLQVIHSERIAGRNDGQHWIEFADEFTPNTDYYDEFMFGAAQVSGPNNFLTIEYINVSEL